MYSIHEAVTFSLICAMGLGETLVFNINYIFRYFRDFTNFSVFGQMTVSRATIWDGNIQRKARVDILDIFRRYAHRCFWPRSHGVLLLIGLCLCED